MVSSSPDLRLHRWVALLFASLNVVAFGIAGCKKEKIEPLRVVDLPEEILSIRVGEPGWVLTSKGLYDPRQHPVALPLVEAGHRLSAAWVDPGGVIWLGYEAGRIYRSSDNGQSWQTAQEGHIVPDMIVFELSARRPVPRRFIRARDGTLYLATVGRGVMRFDEAAGRWVDVTWRFDLNGSVHPMAWTLGRLGNGVAGGFISPRGMIPPSYVDLFGELVRTVDGPGASTRQIAWDPSIRYVVDLGELGGRLVAATLGNGVFMLGDDGFEPLGPDPAPADLFAMDIGPKGEIAAITLSGDVWFRSGSRWRRVRCGGAAERAGVSMGVDVRFSGGRIVAAVGNELIDFHPEEVECPQRGGALVYLALSQHVNLYHSYRGDTNDDDGFGKDIDIIRNTIDMLDGHPTFHNDWDIENLFSLDGWLSLHASDILDDIRRRVEASTDGIRLMSYNNGLMACENLREFTGSVELAKASYEAFVPGLWASGVQPQENTFTPAHVKHYSDLGIGWITLFYSATSFTGFRHEVPLTLEQAHSVLLLESDLYDETMILVPVYHHADVLEHGGLRNWLCQLHQNLSGTTVLAIHFDADGDTWLGFEQEIQDVENMNADWVVPARLQEIVAGVVPSHSVTIRRDVADGVFDGFSSWTEKPVNHLFFTRIVRSRLLAHYARLLSDPPSAPVRQSLDLALEHRLRSLSTTHFGLANPALHPDREAAGDAATIMSETEAATALALVLNDLLVPPLTLVNPNHEPAVFLMPVDEPLIGVDEGSTVRALASADGARVWITGTLSADATEPLDVGEVYMQPESGSGSSWALEALVTNGVEVEGPMVRLHEQEHEAAVEQSMHATGDGGETWTFTGRFEVSDGGAVRYDWIRLDDDPGAWWVEVTVTYPVFEEDDLGWWDDAVPIGLTLAPSESWTVTRRLYTKEVASYSVAEPLDALNAHAADGWVSFRPSAASDEVSVTTYAPMRAALAFLPVRLRLTADQLLQPTLVPFGSLWGELVDHRARSLLGTGVGEDVSRLIGSQFRPAASSWNGRTICFLLRIQPSTGPEHYPRLDAFRDGVLLIDRDGRPSFGRTGFP